MRQWRRISTEGSLIIQTPFEIPVTREMFDKNESAVKQGLFSGHKQVSNLWCFQLYMIHYRITPDPEDFKKIGTFFTSDLFCSFNLWYGKEHNNTQSITIVGLLIHIPRSKIEIDDNDTLLQYFEKETSTHEVILKIPLNRIETLCFK